MIYKEEERLETSVVVGSESGGEMDGWTCAVVLSPYSREIASTVPMIELKEERGNHY